MKSLVKFGIGTAMLTAFAFFPASSVIADDEHHHPSAEHQHGPPSNFQGHRPEHGFHGAPPSFHGSANMNGGMNGRTNGSMNVHGGVHNGSNAGPEHRGMFHGHDYSTFSAQERETWRHGDWRHERHNGHFGWWWYTDGYWFFYPEPIYPYPTYVGSEEYYEEYGEGDYWYWCEEPEGYYPYIQECTVPWEEVPAGD